MKGVQCYELFGGIALKNYAFSFFHMITTRIELWNSQFFLIQVAIRCGVSEATVACTVKWNASVVHSEMGLLSTCFSNFITFIHFCTFFTFPGLEWRHRN